jgi:molybdopterin-guanine dinucleotide biosynthesis protein B
VQAGTGLCYTRPEPEEQEIVPNPQREKKTPVLGVAGWKNSGKTTLIVRLVGELTRRGLSVSTVKHAHHGFEIDDAGADSARHRRAGAREVAVVSSARIAIVHELRQETEPSLEDVLSRLSPADLVIVEGWKSAPIPKIEVRRREQNSSEPLADRDPRVIAIAADHEIDGVDLPVYALDDIAGLADFAQRQLGLANRDASRVVTPGGAGT